MTGLPVGLDCGSFRHLRNEVPQSRCWKSPPLAWRRLSCWPLAAWLAGPHLGRTRAAADGRPTGQTAAAGVERPAEFPAARAASI